LRSTSTRSVATSRCRRLPRRYSSVRNRHGAFQRSRTPLRRTPAREPTAAGIATSRLPSARLGFLTRSAPSRLPVRSRACFIPDPPMGFTLQGFLSSQSRSGFRRPLPSWRLPVVARARPFTGRRDDEHRIVRSPVPCGAGGQAPRWAPTRADRTALAPRDQHGQPLAGPVPPGSRTISAGPGVPDRRTATGSPSGPSSLQRARSPRPVVTPGTRPLPSWASPLQGSLASYGGRRFSASRPSRTFPAASMIRSRNGRRSLRDLLRHDGWTLLLRGASALMRFLTFSNVSRFERSGRLWMPPTVAGDPFGPPPVRFPSSPGVALPLPSSGPLRGGPCAL
jgi:hypothetical protein